MGLLEERANLQGKVAVVVGGAAGIGAAVTTSLAGTGVDVAFCDIKTDELETTRAAVEKMSRRVLAQVANAIDPAELSSFYQAVAAHFDRLDIVVNVVGGVTRRMFMDATPEQCAVDIQRNYGYVLDSVRHAIPLIRKGKRGGSIINFTTIEAHRGAATFAVYAGAKAGLTNFTRALAAELGPERIRVNTLAPDTTPSEGNTLALPAETREKMAKVPRAAQAESYKMYIPMQSSPSTDDLANAVLFLASDLSAYVTGTTIHVDGGTSAALGFINWPFGDSWLPAPFAGTLTRLYGDK
jgi:NAD(P)-dependent dehydrogenase (short-subunit alcohol dehydrogenase family)